jgi:hypothetical protein
MQEVCHTFSAEHQEEAQDENTYSDQVADIELGDILANVNHDAHPEYCIIQSDPYMC